MKTTIEFLHTVYASADMGGSRYKPDMFADRLARAASEATLERCCEHLLKACNAAGERLYTPAVVRMIGVANSSEAPRILRWLRENPKLAAALACTRHDDPGLAEVVDSITLPEASATGAAAPRGDFGIGIRATLHAPMAHGADGKAGNATIFRRIRVLTTTGDTLELPYYSGNAVRGQVRDLLADHLLRALGLPADRAKPVVALWFFYALYSGGALEEKSDATKALRKQLGDHGAARNDGIRTFRDLLPSLSLLGCALGNKVLPGHVQFADLRPVCAEWGTGSLPVAELMTWEFLTRREDHEDHQENHSMIAQTEVIRAGAELEGGLEHDRAIPAIEKAALARGLLLWQDRGMLGAENRRGLGRADITLSNLPDPDPFDRFLVDRKSDILAYLDEITATTKQGDLL